ncbi:MAG: hypothetical protein GXP40_13015 [Chloroflexi bacterium]|nr:hypothetical protein [Chloroflexota bacterium]
MRAERFSSWGRYVLPAALLVGAVVYFFASTPYIGDVYDDSVYVGLAKGIAEGRGYVQTAVPGAPPVSKYPPGWPLLLSSVWLVDPAFPANALGFKLVSVLCTLLFAGITYGWLRWRGETLVVSTLVVLLTLFHPYILIFGTSVFSAMGYACFSVLALWLIERYGRNEQATWRDALLPSLAAAFTMYLRMFGLTLIAGATVYLLLRPDRRKGVIFGALSLAWIAPWLIHLSRLSENSWDYGHELFLKVIERPDLGVIGWGDLIVRIVENVRAYLLAGLPGMILPSQVPLTYVNMAERLQVGAPIGGVDVLLSVLIAAAMLGPILLRHSLIDWYVAFYMGLALLWPWEPTRFLVPLVPLLYLYLLTLLAQFGAALLRRRVRLARVARVLAIGAIGLFVLVNVVHQAGYAWQVQHTVDEPEEWPGRWRLFDWIEENTAETSVLAAMNDYQIYLYTGRQTIRSLASADALAFYDVDYVVLVPYGGVMLDGDLSRIYFDPVREAHPQAFDLVYTDAAAGIEIFRVRQDVLTR